MNRDLITDLLYRTCPGAKILIADECYVFPSEHWVRERFGDALRSLLRALDLDRYAAEENDCDDFARLASAFASVLHKQTLKRVKGVALAFGDFWYVKDSGAGHALNVAIVADAAGDASLLFFEPQSQTIETLSPTEIQSCTALRI